MPQPHNRMLGAAVLLAILGSACGVLAATTAWDGVARALGVLCALGAAVLVALWRRRSLPGLSARRRTRASLAFALLLVMALALSVATTSWLGGTGALAGAIVGWLWLADRLDTDDQVPTPAASGASVSDHERAGGRG